MPRNENEIQERIRYLLCEELDRRVSLAAQRLPSHCVHNYRHPLDVRKTIEGDPNPNFNRVLSVVQDRSIGLCTLGIDDPEEWGGTICEDPPDAQRCPWFKNKVTKEDLKAEFDAQTEDSEWLRLNLPEVYGLVWSIEPVNVSLPWWKRLWFRTLRIRTEPLPPRVDHDHLSI